MDIVRNVLESEFEEQDVQWTPCPSHNRRRITKYVIITKFSRILTIFF